MLHRPFFSRRRRSPRSWSYRRAPRRQRRALRRARYTFASVLCSWRSSLSRIARVVGSKVRHVLVAQGRSDTSHGGMLAGSRLVVLQGLDDIACLLPADLWDWVDLRISRAVVGDAVTSLA